jgi:hypothetical protein
MVKRFALFWVAFMLALLPGFSVLTMGAVPQDSAPKEEKKASATTCLGCHGSYDKIAEATAGFKASSGETVTPHQYVPHAEKKEIPECIECHLPHPIPLEDKSKVIKPTNVDWCYSSCHHASNLKPCKDCH